jgi:DNA-binding NtrC family response regulator
MGGTILLVEDDGEVAEATAMMFEQLGYNVHAVASAKAALDLLDRGDAGIDLVFSDIAMAGPRDGIELARQLRQHRPSLPVVLATGYSDIAESEAGEFQILRKPHRFNELAAAVAAARRSGASPSNLVDLGQARRDRDSRS